MKIEIEITATYPYGFPPELARALETSIRLHMAAYGLEEIEYRLTCPDTAIPPV
jgi:hypothetical protein